MNSFMEQQHVQAHPQEEAYYSWKQQACYYWAAAVAILVLLLYNIWWSSNVLVLRRRERAPASQLPLPPGPTWPYSWPVLGVIPSLSRFIHRDLAKLARTYGPIAYFKLGSIPCVVVSSGEAARELLATRDMEFPDKSEGAALQEILENCKGIAFGKHSEQGVLLRKICAAEVMTRARIKSYESTRRQDGRVMIHSIYKAATDSASTSESSVVDIRSRLAAFAANTTTQILMRKRFHGAVIDETREFSSRTDGPVDFQQIVSLISSVLQLFGTTNVVDYLPFLKWLDPQGLVKKGKIVGIQYGNMLAEIVREHREFHHNNPHFLESGISEEADSSSEHHHVKDFVDVLLLAQKENKMLTDASIKGAISDVLLGGVGATLATVEWVLAILIRHPHQLARVQQEMDLVVGRDRLVEDADLPNLPFLRAVLKEVVRFFPTYHFTFRINPEEAELGGFRIPKQSLVWVHLGMIGHDPGVWKNPGVFDPDRFMDSGNVDFTPKHDRFSFIPFGWGRRGCPGKPLGLALITYSLALLLQAFHWAPPPGLASPQDLDMDETPGVTRSRAVPLRPAVTPRLPPHLYQL